MLKEQKNEQPRAIGYPHDVYLIEDSNKNPRWYHKDPLTIKNRDETSFDLGYEIFEFMEGAGTLAEPLMVRFMIYRKNRGGNFDISVPDKIRRGEIDANIMDMDGNVVEITMRMSGDRNYPLNGIIYDEEGQIKETRRYSPSGECSDGNPSHHLVTIKNNISNP